jgi:adenylate cyclase
LLQAEGGTLDKYIGDAIVMMFGMPLPVNDHAGRACVAALRMQERHRALRQRWIESGQWPEIVEQMRTRIGINTGEAVIGNMGSRVRFNYTMMGDSVNIAARCESSAKTYGVYTVVTEMTLTAALKTVPDLFYRKLDRVIFKGRSETVEIYELWDATVDRAQAGLCRDAYEQGLKSYFKGAWELALVAFERAEQVEPIRGVASVTPSSVLSERCRAFMRDGVPQEWNGAYRMSIK